MRRAGSGLATVGLGVAVGILPAVASPAAGFILAVLAMAILGVVVIRRSMRGRERTRIDNLQEREQTEDPRLTLTRLLFYGGASTVALSSTRAVGGLTLSEVLFILAFFSATLEVLRGRRFVPVQTVILVGTGFFVLGGAISSASAVSVGGSLFQTLHGMYVTLLWAWTATVALRTRRHLLVATTLWVVSVAVDGVGALAQLGGVQALSAASEGGRMTGFTSHPNDLGGAAAIALVPALLLAGVAATSRSRLLVIVAWLPAALVSGALVLAGSVAGFAAAALALLLWLSSPAVRGPARTVLVVLAVAGIALIAVAGGKTTSPVERLQLVTSSDGARTDTGSGEARLTILRQAWPRIAADPLVGVGLDVDSAAIPIIANGVTTPYLTHGFPIAAWYEAGIFGMVGIFIVFGGIAAAGRRALARAATPDEHVAVWAVCSACAALFVYELSAPLVFHQYGWIAAAMLVSWSFRQAEMPAEVGSGLAEARTPPRGISEGRAATVAAAVASGVPLPRSGADVGGCR